MSVNVFSIKKLGLRVICYLFPCFCRYLDDDVPGTPSRSNCPHNHRSTVHMDVMDPFDEDFDDFSEFETTLTWEIDPYLQPMYEIRGAPVYWEESRTPTIQGKGEYVEDLLHAYTPIEQAVRLQKRSASV